MAKVYYIGYYTSKGNPNCFDVFPSINSKMDYIIDSIKNKKNSIEIFSLGESNKFNFTKKQIVDNYEKIYYVSSFAKTNYLYKILSRIWLLLQIVFFILFKVKRNSKVIVYHSYAIINAIKFSVFFKKITLIYEIEEIYKAAWNKGEKEIKKEIKKLSIADKYIFVNDLMDKEFMFNKEFLICYGSYKKNVIKPKIEKEVINIVYAGFIGNYNSDVHLAIDSIRYLSNKYFLKVIGYGSEKDINEMIKKISKINNEYNEKRIQFDGLLSGNELIDYYGKCDIGICTRLLDNKNSNYTFPSKVLVYLSNNLNVVASKIDCIVNSKIEECINFVDVLTPEGVAETILNNKNLVDDQILESLDFNFREDLNTMINDK
ncbi:hypothetical protein DS884_17560 [Tenacibaculum sp. E3R01]|uniref:hypothetical protein n=1 Tax=Tenacibaculum sp. E3R01 TaxID=2267227 RepID=UPI000DE92E97|nr:hypothetical protein [Tenacibaculum sp. E3R01]RBW54261.1 hypothetical protein DS884_17560 [Tenacibaculum sp. E3R01]